MRQKITVFKGDGIGPEITDAVIRVMDAAGAELDYEIYNVGEAEYEAHGELIPKAAFESMERNKVLLKSPITTPVGKGFRSLNVFLRKKYDLYANIRPARSNHAVKTPFQDVDIVIFRENTEDLYVGVEEKIDENTVHATKLITRRASERIIRDAFEYARAHGRKKVTCVHKANAVSMADGLFLACFREVAARNPDIPSDDFMVDATAYYLAKCPEKFDVIVASNQYGDILSDLAAGLVGSLGLAPGANVGENGEIVVEASHGAAPDIAGREIANPIALILSGALLLRHIGRCDQAIRVERAVAEVLNERLSLTPDLGGTGTTMGVAEEIVGRM